MMIRVAIALVAWMPVQYNRTGFPSTVAGVVHTTTHQGVRMTQSYVSWSALSACSSKP